MGFKKKFAYILLAFLVPVGMVGEVLTKIGHNVVKHTILTAKRIREKYYK